MPKITVDNTPVEVPEGTSVLEACRQAGAKIPTLCYLEGVQAIGACRLCLVEIEGARTLVASCAQPVAEGMVVKTNTARARRARRAVLELLLSEHDGDCFACVRSSDCELRKLSIDLGVDQVTYPGQRTLKLIDTSTPALMRDTGKCVMCRRCVTVCNDIQGVGALFPQGTRLHHSHRPCFREQPQRRGLRAVRTVRGGLPGRRDHREQCHRPCLGGH